MQIDFFIETKPKNVCFDLQKITLSWATTIILQKLHF